MTPNPPVWMRHNSTPLPKGLSTALISSGESPVTQTAEVARKQASMGLMLWPVAQLAGRPSSTDPATITARNDNTGQVKGLKKRFLAIARLCQPEQVNARQGMARRALQQMAYSVII